MTSDLSIFAARLRDFISICADEPAFTSEETGPALQAHHDAEFNGMALVLFALQFAANAPYRKFCEARQVRPDSVTHWTQIPAMPSVAFKELELTALPPHERTTVFHSSGTTEQRPSRHFHSAESLAIYEASLWPWFQAHLLPDKLKLELQRARDAAGVQALACSDRSDNFTLSILSPPATTAPHSSLAHMFDVVRRNLGAPAPAFAGKIAGDGSWTLDFTAVLAALRVAAENRRPLILLGTAFSFVHLLDYLAEQNLRFELPTGSRVMETGGYKGRSRALPKAELHSLISEYLGIPVTHIVCEYGMSELSSQAYDSEPRDEKSDGRDRERVFRFPPWARAQIISPETGHEVAEGQTGLLRIFDLANVFSVMAIQTEDLALSRDKGFELIGRAEQAEARGCSLMSSNS